MRILNWKRNRAERIQQIKYNFEESRFVTDFGFDFTVFPDEIAALSETHWTRVFVAMMAIRMLAPDPETRILDVGSGCGKFCLVGAMSSPGKFTGIEIREDLYEIAQAARSEFQIENVQFIHGDMADLDWCRFDAFYFYNPFIESPGRDRPANALEEFFRCTEIVRAKLRDCPVGTKVVTHHGFGGEMPRFYKCIETHAVGGATLDLWIKGD